MAYSFLQVSTPIASKLLLNGIDEERRFQLVRRNTDPAIRDEELTIAENNVFFERHHNLTELDFKLDTLFDPKHVRSEMAAGRQANISEQDNREAVGFIKQEVLGVAKRFGYPNPLQGILKSELDHEMAIKIWSVMKEFDMRPLEAADDAVWNFLQALALPSYSVWRWEDNNKLTSKVRILGKTRGSLSVLWWRYEVLTEHGKYEYEDWIRSLTQDDFQGIMERPGMRGYIPAIRMFGRFVARLRHSDRISDMEKTKLVRAAAKRFRVMAGTTNLWFLDLQNSISDRTIEEDLRRIFANASTSIGLSLGPGDFGPL